MEEKSYTQAQLEEIIKTRVAKVAQRATQAEERAAALQAELKTAGKSQATIDLLTNQIEEYKGQLSTSERKFSRYQAISKHGLDPAMSDAIEWSYEKSQKDIAKKDKVSLNDWLSNCITAPEKAPLMLRPHLTALQNTAPEENPPESTPQDPQAQRHAQRHAQRLQQRQIVSPNRGVQAAPETSKIIERALRDPKFYKENREAVQQAYRNQVRTDLRERK